MKERKGNMVPEKLKAAAEPQDPSKDREPGGDSDGILQLASKEEEVNPEETHSWDHLHTALDYILDNSDTDLAVVCEDDLLAYIKDTDLEHEKYLTVDQVLKDYRPGLFVEDRSGIKGRSTSKFFGLLIQMAPIVGGLAEIYDDIQQKQSSSNVTAGASLSISGRKLPGGGLGSDGLGAGGSAVEMGSLDSKHFGLEDSQVDIQQKQSSAPPFSPHSNNPYYSNRARGQSYKQQSGFAQQPQAPPVQGPQGAFFVGTSSFSIKGGSFEGGSFDNNQGDDYSNKSESHQHHSVARNANLNTTEYSHYGRPRRGAHFPSATNISSLDGQNYSEQSEEQYWQEEVEYSVPIGKHTQQQQQKPRAFKSNNPFHSYVERRS
ncbi:hypothetical protein BT96DRAFT_364463 [Gymnopus androsaceus JB14]|uniref:Uncharacterized protein n=1 Tax=Gymnopus androsaceus JB14 TaxID=1447944 RepID=A0A6A4GY11_9AGAR|nr:hypothetical protein BT96DRAFT_364463 [Gymnopus androsaceus JB14]